MKLTKQNDISLNKLIEQGPWFDLSKQMSITH